MMSNAEINNNRSQQYVWDGLGSLRDQVGQGRNRGIGRSGIGTCIGKYVDITILYGSQYVQTELLAGPYQDLIYDNLAHEGKQRKDNMAGNKHVKVTGLKTKVTLLSVSEHQEREYWYSYR